MKRLVQLAAALLLSAAPASAATLIVDSNGILTGANGVIIAGTSYDVQFIDGLIGDALFFSDGETAILAAQGLLDQVFVGAFDNNPSLTRGCDVTNGNDFCNVVIPYLPATTVTDFAVASNFGVLFSDPDQTFSGTIESGFNTSVAFPVTTARFSLSAVTGAVPEPSTWAMMLMGFGAMGFAFRRRKRVASLTQMA